MLLSALAGDQGERRASKSAAYRERDHASRGAAALARTQKCGDSTLRGCSPPPQHMAAAVYYEGISSFCVASHVPGFYVGAETWLK